MTNSLRRSFLSIKGIYYQATIQGQDIMWLVPYRFVQRVNGDVDYRIMATFVEFYTTLLGFVNFRLYSGIGLRYPPKFDTRSDENGAELAAFTLEGRTVGEVPKAIEAGKAQASGNSNKEVSKELQAKVDKVIKKAGLEQSTDDSAMDTTEENTDAIDRFETEAPEADTLPQPSMSGNEAGALFAPFVFYISREAPKAPLEFILRSFGCKRVGWASVLGDGAFTHDETDPRITHQIVDRPQLPQESLPTIPAGETTQVQPGNRIPGRTYIQPQWVWDCINDGKLLRADLYAPGATLPPHLSPWVKATRGAYDPRATLAEQEEEDEAENAADASDSDEEMEDEPVVEQKAAESDAESVDGGMDVAGTDDDESDESEEEVEDFGGFEEGAASESEDDDEAARTQHQKELEAEAAGLPFTAGATDEAAKKKAAKSKKIAAKKQSEDDELDRQKMMMSRKKRKLLEKMMYSNKKTADESAKLRSKRRKLEKGEKGDKTKN
jgi:pescadillo protein